MFFQAEMAFNQLTSTAVQLYDEWIKDAGKPSNILYNGLESKYPRSIKSAAVFLAVKYTGYLSHDARLLFM